MVTELEYIREHVLQMQRSICTGRWTVSDLSRCYDLCGKPDGTFNNGVRTRLAYIKMEVDFTSYDAEDFPGRQMKSMV